jgi:hypothetical protein
MVLQVPTTQPRTALSMPAKQLPTAAKHAWMALASVLHKLPMHEKKDPMARRSSLQRVRPASRACVRQRVHRCKGRVVV